LDFFLACDFLMQAVPLSARKVAERNANAGVLTEGIAPFLQLPHFSEGVVKKLGRKVSKHVT
jgi:translocation protein SEC63